MGLYCGKVHFKAELANRQPMSCRAEAVRRFNRLGAPDHPQVTTVRDRVTAETQIQSPRSTREQTIGNSPASSNIFR